MTSGAHAVLLCGLLIGRSIAGDGAVDSGGAAGLVGGSIGFPFATSVELAGGNRPGRIPVLFGRQPWADGDEDGLPDAWELQFGLNPSAPDGDLDPDLDGVTSRDEWIAGTNPRSAASVLTLAAPVRVGDRLRFQIETVGGRVYRLWGGENLRPGDWELISVAVGTGEHIALDVLPNSKPQQFYVLEVRIP